MFAALWTRDLLAWACTWAADPEHNQPLPESGVWLAIFIGLVALVTDIASWIISLVAGLQSTLT
jgi:hypothetical protein